MYKTLIIVFAMFLLAGCDFAENAAEKISEEYGLADNYPFLKPGSAIIQGQSLVDISGNNDPIIFAFDSGCRLLTSSSTFGQHSLEIIPKSITCPDGTEIALNPDQISKAYIDKRFFDYAEMSVPFQVYDTTILAARTPR